MRSRRPHSTGAERAVSPVLSPAREPVPLCPAPRQLPDSLLTAGGGFQGLPQRGGPLLCSPPPPPAPAARGWPSAG